MGDFDFGSYSSLDAPAVPSGGGGLFGDGQVTYGPAFTGSTNMDVLQAGGTMNQAGIPQGGGNFWTQLFGSNAGGAPMPGSSESATGSGNWWNNLFSGGGVSDALGLIGKGAGIGSSILGGVAGIQNMQRGAKDQRYVDQSQRQLQQLGSQTAGPALQLMTAGSSGLLTGQLNPELEAIVQQKKAEYIAKYRDYYARAGIGSSTMMADIEARAEQDAQVLRSQLASQEYSSGLQGIQGAYAPTAMAGEIAAQALGGSTQQASALQNSIYKILNS